MEGKLRPAADVYSFGIMGEQGGGGGKGEEEGGGPGEGGGGTLGTGSGDPWGGERGVLITSRSYSIIVPVTCCFDSC